MSTLAPESVETPNLVDPSRNEHDIDRTVADDMTGDMAVVRIGYSPSLRGLHGGMLVVPVDGRKSPARCESRELHVANRPGSGARPRRYPKPRLGKHARLTTAAWRGLRYVHPRTRRCPSKSVRSGPAADDDQFRPPALGVSWLGERDEHPHGRLACSGIERHVYRQAAGPQAT